ncbi:hypothetical protein [Actinomadura sp. WMMA1423]|uniref:hypothetical protein n=1 Tax=Actinomadura sp. WMMA1423 TaxID=2591108 RepID=UPI0011462A4C|nr:hypothetical protein [Actinomadura sp. WMMA1423]
MERTAGSEPPVTVTPGSVAPDRVTLEALHLFSLLAPGHLAFLRCLVEEFNRGKKIAEIMYGVSTTLVEEIPAGLRGYRGTPPEAVENGAYDQ